MAPCPHTYMSLSVYVLQALSSWLSVHILGMWAVGDFMITACKVPGIFNTNLLITSPAQSTSPPAPLWPRQMNQGLSLNGCSESLETGFTPRPVPSVGPWQVGSFLWSLAWRLLSSPVSSCAERRPVTLAWRRGTVKPSPHSFRRSPSSLTGGGSWRSRLSNGPFCADGNITVQCNNRMSLLST